MNAAGVVPAGLRARLFDLDGVLTRTAVIHAAAWKGAFDRFLADQPAREGLDLCPFDAVADYQRYVDGESREDGVRAFLAARGLRDPDPAAVASLASEKNAGFLRLLRHDGVQVYDDAVRYLRASRSRGLRCAVVSSSTNCRHVLRAAGIEELFDLRVDGETARRHHLRGKPAPDTYAYAARAFGLPPAECMVIEDAVAGVQAGAAGGFGAVVGVDRTGHADQLAAAGATIVVRSIDEIDEEPAG